MIDYIDEARLRLARETDGFTLIELLMVLVIIGILLTIAVPSYVGFRDRANDRAAAGAVRSAVPAVEAYYADNGSYLGMDLAALRLIDAGTKLDGVGTVTASTYCVAATVNGSTWSKAGPAAVISSGACP